MEVTPMGSPSDNVAELKIFWTFRDGMIVEYHELYDTAALLAAARP
jgi:ketosteroid isomerase-like protein